MLKKLLKGCLTIAMVSALAIPAMAAEGSFSGRVRAYVTQESVKDGASTLQFGSDSRFGATFSGEAGDWTASAKTELQVDYNDGGGTSKIATRDTKVGLANDAMSINFGRMWAFGIGKGMAYNYGNVAGFTGVGEAVNAPRGDYLKVGLKNVGLDVILGMNNYNGSNDATGDQFQETTIGVIFSKSMGALALAAEYASQSRAIDTEYGDGAVEKSANDGYSASDLALAVEFALSDMMAVGLNFESASTQSGVEGADPVATTVMELFFDMGLDESMGISVGYGTKSVNDGSDNATASSMIDFAFGKKMGAMNLFVEYASSATKDDDTGEDSGSSTVGAGMAFNF